MIPNLKTNKAGQPEQPYQHGIYRLYWYSGGSSLASVGSCYDGTRWYAPINWISGDAKDPHPKHPLVAAIDWSYVDRYLFICIENDDEDGLDSD
jgi:hypothetical protein